MRVNVYAEELPDEGAVEIVGKEIEGRTFTGLRIPLYLPVTLPDGTQARGKFMHHADDDDSSAVTIWGKRDLRILLREALAKLDQHYETGTAEAEAAGTAPLGAPEIGSELEGGYYTGAIRVDGELYGVIVAPKAEGETQKPWGNFGETVDSADSRNDGKTNTNRMSEAGSELAAWAAELDINGYQDWYLPSKDELELMYRHLKPTDEENFADGDDGINPSSEPEGKAYEDETPGKTTLGRFQEGGPEAFDDWAYWSSTQYSADLAWLQYFDVGIQGYDPKGYALRARAVRRFKLPI